MKKRELSKTEVQWILAFNYGIVEEFYRDNYFLGAPDDFKVTKSLIGSTVYWVLDSAKGWNDAIWHLKSSNTLIELSEEKREFKFNEIYYHAFRYWAFNLTRKVLTDLAPNWEEISKEFRLKYKLDKEEGK